MDADYNALIEQLDGLVRKAKGVPLSSSAVIPRDEALGLIQEIRNALPKEHELAREVLADRDAVLAQAKLDAEAILDEARGERERMLSRTELVRTAKSEAERIMADAESAAAKLRTQADDYVDSKLAKFEILLNKTVKTVNRGREQLRRRLEAAQDEVMPLNLDDSGEISGELPLGPQ